MSINGIFNCIAVTCLIVLCAAQSAYCKSDDKALDLIREVVESVGGVDNLRAKKDVEYVYVVKGKSGKMDISVEKYIFDGELSRGEYYVHENNVLPDKKGEVVEGYDGKSSWTTLNGKELFDADAKKRADFIRKTNYYWFTMMFKLLDPGTNHQYIGIRNVDGINYQIVKMTFDQGTGDASDTYLLYINPDTHLIDRFLFTVMDFNVTQPNLMIVNYRKYGNILLPVYRKYTKADWEGNIKSTRWTQEICVNPEFNNGFKTEVFEKPE